MTTSTPTPTPTPYALRGILVRHPSSAERIDSAVSILYTSLPHHDSCAVFTDLPGTPYRCTCWKEVLRLTMLEAYDLLDSHPNPKVTRP